MSHSIANGVWPTMITPFTASGEVDYVALEALVEWYISNGVQGLFAVCQSSEMFFLSLQERLEIARFVKQQAAGRVQVIASGHISDAFEDQVHELTEMAATGVDAVVLVSNRLAQAEEGEDIWIYNAQKLLDRIPNVQFGVYECPYPYKRLLTPETLKWCADTGRFLFLKDTCCDRQQLEDKLSAIEGSGLKLYNANSATLLHSLRHGAAGYSGVMANFHPDLYVELTEQWNSALKHEDTELLQSFLTAAALIELQVYPVNAKYHLQQLGLPFDLTTRTKAASLLKENHRTEVVSLEHMAEIIRQRISNAIPGLV